MCGRFQASTSAAEVARWFKTSGPLPNLRPTLQRRASVSGSQESATLHQAVRKSARAAIMDSGSTICACVKRRHSTR
jgi:hypothetical protein